MSGAGIALGAAAVLAPLLTGGYPVQLGDFTFQSREVPEVIELGGKQAMHVHKMPGGARVIDAMGRDDINFTWSGHFLATLLEPDIDIRVQELEQMRIDGDAVPFLVGWQQFTVVIESFTYKVRKAGHYEYSITVVPITFPDPDDAPQSLLGSLTSQLGDALNINMPAVLSTVTTVVSAISPAITAAVGILVAPKSQAATPVLSTVNNAISTVSSLQNSSTIALANATTLLANVVGTPGTAHTAIQLLNTLGNATNNVTALNQVGSILNNMQSTLNGSKTS